MSEMHQRGMNRVGENRGVMKKKPARNPGVCNRVPLRDIKNWAPAPSNPLVVNKQGLTEKSNLEDNNPTFVPRRPITRSFATTLSSTSDAHQQESKEIYEEIGNEKRHKLSIPTVSCASSLDYSMTTDVHEHKASDELRLPTEEEMEEMEIEIEDLMMERIPNIDSYDCDDPLSVVDYVNEIYSFYQKTEIKSCVSPDYMSTQLDINEKMRAILIDWLIEVHYKFELMDETLFRTVNIIDRFLEQQAIERKKLQLVGVTAMLLACKYEEVYVPVVEDLILISDRAYTRDEVLNMETLIINTLKFNISLPTPYVFMRRFLKAAQSDRKLELLSFFIIELCLVEYKMLKFKPSLLAAAAIYTAQCSLNGFKQWTRTCQLHSSYSQEQLLECSMLMVDFHHNAGSGKLTGVHRKYSTSRYGCAAKSEPALFLLENQSLVELSAARRGTHIITEQARTYVVSSLAIRSLFRMILWLRQNPCLQNLLNQLKCLPEEILLLSPRSVFQERSCFLWHLKLPSYMHAVAPVQLHQLSSRMLIVKIPERKITNSRLLSINAPIKMNESSGIIRHFTVSMYCHLH